MNYFVDPEYITYSSLMNKYLQFHGNLELVQTLTKMTTELSETVDLYEAQDIVKQYCINTFGMNFYEKNIEAINALIENEYCNKERLERSFFDEEFYEQTKHYLW